MSEAVKAVAGKKYVENVQEAYEKGKEYHCQTIVPPNADYIAHGQGRCVYAKDDKVIKVAHGADGIRQNRNAKKAIQHMKEDQKKAFAMPLDVTGDNVVMTQEKARPFKSRDKDKYGYRESVEAVKDKVTPPKPVQCRDVRGHNMGIMEEKGVVLTDLGNCNV